MDYNCFPFSCCITWGSSTRTKFLASEGHTHSRDSKNQSEEQFKLQKTPKYRALCDVMQPQAGQSWQFCTLQLLCVLSISITGTWPCLWLFHMQMSPELAFNMQEIYSFQPFSWSSVMKTLIFFLLILVEEHWAIFSCYLTAAPFALLAAVLQHVTLNSSVLQVILIEGNSSMWLFIGLFSKVLLNSLHICTELMKNCTCLYLSFRYFSSRKFSAFTRGTGGCFVLLEEVGLQADPQLWGCACRERAGPSGQHGNPHLPVVLGGWSQALLLLQQGTAGGWELAWESLSSKAEVSRGCAGSLLPGGPSPGLAAAPPSSCLLLFFN